MAGEPKTVTEILQQTLGQGSPTFVKVSAYNLDAGGNNFNAGADNGDGLAMGTSPHQRVQALNWGFNGVTYDRLRTVSSGGSGLGVIQVGQTDASLFRTSSLQTFAPAAAATITRISGVNTNQNLLASNTSRKGTAMHNDSTASLYVKFGATAVSAGASQSFTVKMAPNSYYEFPDPIYTGAVDGIWDGTNGAVLITELT